MQKVVIKRITSFWNAKNVSTKSVSVVPGVGRLGCNREVRQYWEWKLNAFFSGLLIFHVVVEPRISSKSAKSREIHKNTRNPAKFARNLTKYMSVQHI